MRLFGQRAMWLWWARSCRRRRRRRRRQPPPPPPHRDATRRRHPVSRLTSANMVQMSVSSSRDLQAYVRRGACWSLEAAGREHEEADGHDEPQAGGSRGAPSLQLAPQLVPSSNAAWDARGRVGARVRGGTGSAYERRGSSSSCRPPTAHQPGSPAPRRLLTGRVRASVVRRGGNAAPNRPAWARGLEFHAAHGHRRPPPKDARGCRPRIGQNPAKNWWECSPGCAARSPCPRTVPTPALLGQGGSATHAATSWERVTLSTLA